MYFKWNVWLSAKAGNTFAPPVLSVCVSGNTLGLLHCKWGRSRDWMECFVMLRSAHTSVEGFPIILETDRLTVGLLGVSVAGDYTSALSTCSFWWLQNCIFPPHIFPPQCHWKATGTLHVDYYSGVYSENEPVGQKKKKKSLTKFLILLMLWGKKRK